MKRINIVTLSRLRRAVRAVRRELREHGFLSAAVAQVEVYLVPLGGAYGWQDFGGDSGIYVPAVSLSKLGDLLRGRYTSLRDVVRHEYGHCVADLHHGLIRQHRFITAFWAPHGDETPVRFDPEIHVTEYAAKNTSEDWCETFMVYLRHGGRLPVKFDTATIRAKWEFVRWVGKRIGGR